MMRSSWRGRRIEPQDVNELRCSAGGYDPLTTMQTFRYRPELLEGVTEDLTGELKQYEDWFMVDGAKLKLITDHFVKELEKGLSLEGGCIVSTIPVRCGL